MSALVKPDDIYQFLKKHPKLIFADEYELAIQHEATQTRKFLSGKSVERGNREECWVSVRVLHRKRPGGATTTDTSPNGLRVVVENALLAADQSSMDPWFRFPLWKNLGTSGKPSTAGQYDSLATCISTIPPALEEFYLTRSIQTLLARKSEKYELHSFQSGHEGHLSLASASSGDIAVVRERWASPVDLADRGSRLERLSGEAAFHAALESRPVSISEAKGLVLAPRVVADWVENLALSLDASEFLRGRTFWDGTENTVSSAFTLIDDPAAETTPYYTRFDLEGTPTQKNILIDGGQRRSLLHNAYTSCRENRVSTGNFSRTSGSADATIQPWHLALEGGQADKPWKNSGLVAYIDQCSLSIKSKYSPANWSRVLAGLLMRHGEPVARIRPFRVHWSHLELLRAVTDADKSIHSFGRISCPALWWDKMPKETKDL